MHAVFMNSLLVAHSPRVCRFLRAPKELFRLLVAFAELSSLHFRALAKIL